MPRLGGEVGGRQREDAASLLVLRKRRAARGHFKNGGEKNTAGEKEVIFRALGDANTAF